ncbi:MAG: CDP-alcohol phosphatidyltransferase family protein [Burkholderiales bacterium]|jgi:cardiolipin synthase|nr:CDP-alcohol phosphatidyltransferase family protein [Burkholderiales bacterium]
MRQLPNAITVLRAALIPLQAWLLLRGDYGLAFALFVVSGLSDLADGWIARRFDLRTRFGAIADPLADKITMLTVALLLATQGWLPWWFALLVVGRDLLIVGGAAAYHFLIGEVEMAPSFVSKLNTALEFGFLAGVLALAAGHLDEGPWFAALLYATAATVIASGASYVLVWSRKAMHERRAATRR